MKINLMKWGYLHFDDAYFLANRYLHKFSKVKNIIQKRFNFVFVDEMQDMDNHQYQLLEDLFFEDGNGNSQYQRIGDKNQAIFSGDSKIKDLWIDRENKLELNGSHRLSENIANVVQPFALQQINIVGLGKNADGSDITIPPYIILYDDHSQENLISKFAKIINEYKENNQIPDEANNKYCVIAWNTKPDETIGKMRLPDYYPEYSSEEAKKYIDYSTLESYLNFYDEDSKSLYSIRRNILNAFIKILRLEKLFDKNSKDGQRDRIFTKRNLLKYFREEKNDFYNQFKLLIFRWSFATAKGNKEKLINEIRDFIPTFLSKFERANPTFDNSINESKSFINDPCPSATETNEENPNPEKRNLIKYEGIGEIQVGTVHSVKGQTHTATLYLETSYYSDGGKSYESQRLSEQFKSNNLNGTEGERVKQSAKMAYVGFSRPTHLLCLGIHIDRFETFLKENLPDNWKVIDC
jgi:DNA helicase II / ATP-dependent DNA helicase PcrA